MHEPTTSSAFDRRSRPAVGRVGSRVARALLVVGVAALLTIDRASSPVGAVARPSSTVKPPATTTKRPSDAKPAVTKPTVTKPSVTKPALKVGAKVTVKPVASPLTTVTPTTVPVAPSTTGDGTPPVTATPASLPAPTLSPGPQTTSPPNPQTSAQTLSRVAVATSAGIDVFPSADSFARERILFGLQNSGAPTVFLIVGEQGDRYQVQLPVRPNGTTGWIEKRTVTTFSHAFRIEVSLDAHEILVTNGAATVLRARIGVGRSTAPTPGGTYYTTQLLKTPNPAGAYGPYAYGLSGFSETLTSFAGGEAVIGLHGTNRPDLLGGDVSSGCIRLANADITFLAGLLPIGVPVVIAP